jgi:hypothetical protein
LTSKQNTINTTTFSFLKNHRFWLAGPVTLMLSIFTMAAMSLWFPPGIANVNHLVFPLVIFPLLWAVSFFYSLLEVNIKRAWVTLVLVLLANAVPVIASIAGWL